MNLSILSHCLWTVLVWLSGLIPQMFPKSLFICRRQNQAVFNDVSGMLDAAGGIAAGLLSLANENSVEYTRGEIAIMYDAFVRSFDTIVTERNSRGWGDSNTTLDNLTLHWHVDYGPDHELADIMRAATKPIRENREATCGPKLPMGWGLGFKCSYIVKDGCATYEGSVIDHSGNALSEDPWHTFYKSENSADEQRAHELMPVRTRDMYLL